MSDFDELIKYHQGKCNRYINGRCYTRRCLVRGGWAPYHIELHDLRVSPTCEEHETVQALEKLKELSR